MRFLAIFRLCGFIVAYALLCSAPGFADSPTAEELCRKRNSASCEINGLRFFIEDDCPRGAKVLRPKGNERCEIVSENVKAAGKITGDVINKQVSPPMSDSNPVNPVKNAEKGFFENPLFVVAVLGLLQGFISRIGWRSFIIVAMVIPVIVTWSVVTDTSVNLVGEAYWGFVAWSLLKIFSCSMLGWGAGLAAHMGLLKFLHK
jgi:hypothetical protein